MQRQRFESVHDDEGAHKTTLRHLMPHVVVLSLHYLFLENKMQFQISLKTKFKSIRLSDLYYQGYSK